MWCAFWTIISCLVQNSVDILFSIRIIWNSPLQKVSGLTRSKQNWGTSQQWLINIDRPQVCVQQNDMLKDRWWCSARIIRMSSYTCFHTLFFLLKAQCGFHFSAVAGASSISMLFTISKVLPSAFSAAVLRTILCAAFNNYGQCSDLFFWTCAMPALFLTSRKM